MTYSNPSDLLTHLNDKLATHTISKHNARLDKTFPPNFSFLCLLYSGECGIRGSLVSHGPFPSLLKVLPAYSN